MKEEEVLSLLQDVEDEISEVGFTKHHFNVLEKLSYEKDPYVLAKVAELLVCAPEVLAESILVRLAKETDSLVRCEACDSLCNSKSKEIYELLGKVAAKDKNGMVRGYASASLLDVAKNLSCEKDALRRIKELEKKEKVVFTRIMILTALYMLGDKNSILPLINYLDTRDYRNRCATVKSLAEITDETNKEMITNVLVTRRESEKSYAVVSTIDDALIEIAGR